MRPTSQFNTFTISEASKIIGNIPATKKHIKSMVDSGYIHKIRKNLYTCYNFALNDDCANRFQIASNINENSYISYHSAFEFYGFYNQMYYKMQVSPNKRFTPFEYNGYSYVCYLNNINLQIDLIQGVRITSLERTIVDSINMLGKIMDIEEFIKCLDLIHLINERKIIEILKAYDKEVLYRKVGYILSFYKDDFKLSDSFFELCLSKWMITNHGSLVSNDTNHLIYNAKWGLDVYPNLKNISNKGGNADV